MTLQPSPPEADGKASPVVLVIARDPGARRSATAALGPDHATWPIDPGALADPAPLLDADDPVQFDPQRDVYFERARLGLADVVDRRGYAEASHVYRGMRERYGMVRARESILPFDVVIQGSLTDMSIGAFPRIRMPKKTPDAILFE